MKSVPIQTIELHEQAPPKPDFGAPCNRCGVCCATKPCPVAYLYMLQFKGRCKALLWQEDVTGYACGMVLQPDVYSRLIPKTLRLRMGRFFASRIAAGKGCDAKIEWCDSEI
jgi:hypothetical protein